MQVGLKSALAVGLPLVLFALTALAQPATQATVTPEQTAFFEAKIRPLLLAKCVGCHGEAGALGNLRLDQPLSVERAALVLQRVRGQGGKPRMPQGDAPLSPTEIATLDAWHKQGAPWPQSSAPAQTSLFDIGKTHWAFQSLTNPAVPTVKNTAWVRNPIDAFVLTKLEAKKLKPSPTASRRELIRRLSYDLIGLPPTPEEVAAFEKDTDPHAYEKLVDRLLASPHYGEKWGRHWLDLVRYAETNSYERDNPKPNPWRYRDYVIQSFNADKPYDRFVKEQLAGDEMPDGGNDGLIATGFYRLGIWDDEPTDREQARYDGLDDIVATVGQTFLGLTLDCARCHNHKIDPLLQKDYYKMVAFFNGINHFRNGGPTDEKPIFNSESDRAAYLERVAQKKKDLNELQLRVRALERGASQEPAEAGASDFDGLTYRYYRDTFDKLPNFDLLKAERSGPVPSKRIDITLRDRDSAIGFVFEGNLIVPHAGKYTFYLAADDGARLLVDGQEIGKYDGARGQNREQTYEVTLKAGRVPFRLDYFQNVDGIGLSLAWSGPQLLRRRLSALQNNGPERRANGTPTFADPEKAREYQRLTRELEALKNRPVAADRALCVTELNEPLDTFVLLRGSAAAHGDQVQPGFPEILGGGTSAPTPRVPVAASSGESVRGARSSVPSAQISETSSGRRLTLANWITAPNNRLTSRVIVNRVFQHHFGRGIVRSSNNFGLGGDAPTHPELLDWLAYHFSHQQGWRLKQLHKLILMSNTYKQSAHSNPVALKSDPRNDLLWRFDMRRLTAEEIRDSVLAISGNLNLALYGPSIYPNIPQEVLQGQSVPGKDWYPNRMKPEDKARRSIYIFVKRSLVFPLLDTFDLAETDRTTPVRFTSTQPTQALTLLNGAFFNEQATILAGRLDKEAGAALDSFVARALTLATQRPATAAEVARGARLIQNLEARGLPRTKAKAYFCLLTLNLNEFMYLD